MLLQPRLIALKQRNPNLKVMFAAGGWKEGSTGFVEITKTEETRMKFVQNVIKFLREFDFDGLDLNWQHPTFRQGGGPEDKANYVLLAQVRTSGVVLYIFIITVIKLILIKKKV